MPCPAGGETDPGLDPGGPGRRRTWAAGCGLRRGLPPAPDPGGVSGVHLLREPGWERNNILASLFCAEPAMEGGFLCSYADIVYRPLVVQRLLDSTADITLAVDTDFRRRYLRRSHAPGVGRGEGARRRASRCWRSAGPSRPRRPRASTSASPATPLAGRPCCASTTTAPAALRGGPLPGGPLAAAGLPDPSLAGDARSGGRDAAGGYPRRVLRDRHHRGLPHRPGRVDRCLGRLSCSAGAAASARRRLRRGAWRRPRLWGWRRPSPGRTRSPG